MTAEHREGSDEPRANGSSTPHEGPENDRLFPVVGIGASAGGLEALNEFFQAMSVDSGMAFVVVSHLDPEHKIALAEILMRVSRIPVREIEDGMAVEANNVYVMPPNRELTIRQGTLRLAARPETRRAHMPIDAFLRSLAADRGLHAIGVVLSGTGTDGTLGLKAIKEEGGITFCAGRHGSVQRDASKRGLRRHRG